MKRALPLLAAAAALTFAAGAAQAQGDAQRGSHKVAMCEGCHQIVGYQADFPIVYKVPMIAGQDAAYLAAALTEYRAGDRKFPTMRAIAAPLTDEDIADIAAFYSQLGKPDGPVPKTLEQPVPAELAAKVATCTSCHGPNFSTPIAPNIPRLAGQYRDYLYFAYRSYAVEGNPHYGRSNAMMAPMSKLLSDAELKDFTTYLSELPGELRTVQDPHFK
jgi:cytochrome c553